MPLIHLKLKNGEDIRRISCQSEGTSFETISKGICAIFEKQTLPSLSFLHGSCMTNIENEGDWNKAIEFALANNNNLALVVTDMSDSMLKEQEDFVVIEDFAPSVFESNAGQQEEAEMKSEPANPQEKPEDFVDSLNQFLHNIPDMVGANANNLSQMFQQMTTSVDSTIESVKPTINQMIANNHSQFEQVACTVKDTVEDAIKTAQQNLNELFSAPSTVDGSGPLLEATFVADVNIPDGSVLEPGCQVTKTWQVKNTGRTAWPQGCSLQFVGGKKMNLQEYVRVPAAGVQETVSISINIQVPDTPGRHACYFRLCCPVNGKTFFGTRLWCEVVVPGEPEEEFEYQEQLERLVEMGFPSDVCKPLLIENKGNFEETVHELLN